MKKGPLRGLRLEFDPNGTRGGHLVCRKLVQNQGKFNFSTEISFFYKKTGPKGSKDLTKGLKVPEG